MINETIKIIGTIDFHDMKVKVYYDKTSNEQNVTCSWQARNPDSYYQGVMYMDNKTGKCSYPKDAIIPEQTIYDREIIPKFIIVGQDVLLDMMVEKINKFMESQYLIRNKNSILIKRYLRSKKLSRLNEKFKNFV